MRRRAARIPISNWRRTPICTIFWRWARCARRCGAGIRSWSARWTCTTRSGGGMPHHLPALRQGTSSAPTRCSAHARPSAPARFRFSRAMATGCSAASTPISCKPPRNRAGKRCRPILPLPSPICARWRWSLPGPAQFRLSPGDVVLWHNWSWLHGRTAFEDDPEQRRLLLRLWLRSDLCPPADIRFAERSVTIDDDHERTRREGMRVE
ncbi:TauD/TfdA family dioxygenase (plasmid) [Novosphingobium sp. EMRT-2]|nr:TauD/TfdA family dioxygenase [Novosphingobium sp. EMRT-2]